MYKDIKVLIFDLDGTLYEDTHHFDFYAEKLCEKLPPNDQEAFKADYAAILNGEHPLKMGMSYDAVNDVIIKHRDGKVTEVYRWNGQKVLDHQLGEWNQHSIQHDYHSLLHIGDLWWVPAAVARHYGIAKELAEQSFLETREYMMTPTFKMADLNGYKELLEKLSIHKKLVLLTNSPQKDSEVILSKLGFSPFFADNIFNGQKPIQTKHHIHKIKEKYEVEYENILCIGDNAINEILPAKELGCKTLLIDPHNISESSDADVIVRNLSEMLDVLRGLI
ncbi:MAG: HAD family hydrolase [Heyndrickxia sp.]